MTGDDQALRLESALAALLADAAALERFLADPEGYASAAGLTPTHGAALAAIDRTGLLMAARSCAAKRNRTAKGSGPVARLRERLTGWR